MHFGDVVLYLVTDIPMPASLQSTRVAFPLVYRPLIDVTCTGSDLIECLGTRLLSTALLSFTVHDTLGRSD